MIEKCLVFAKNLLPKPFLEFLLPPYHFFLAWFAAFFYGFPSRRLKVIGVTGTNGKTTVVELLHEIFREAGFKVASVSSLRFKFDAEEVPNILKMTMPGRMRLQKFLHQARKRGAQFAILEVTSEGIKQYRHRFINFKTAVITNVSPEHLESHGGFEKYLRAKLDLFWRLPKDGLAVINRTDENFKRFAAATRAYKLFYSPYSIEFGDRVWKIDNLSIKKDDIEFELAGVEFKVPLRGKFNFYNILAAVSAALVEHISLEKIASALARISGVSGRLEFIQREPFAVVVDYAHTPDALRDVYAFLRAHQALHDKGQKLICVLGAAGGGRDKWKRPEFGRIAVEFCDKIILTNEDPYDENPQDILDQIASGFLQVRGTSSVSDAREFNTKLPNFRKILDRREAIRKALRSAEKEDTVIITGKGAEPWIMGPGGTKTPWDDRGVVREELEALKSI